MKNTMKSELFVKMSTKFLLVVFFTGLLFVAIERGSIIFGEWGTNLLTTTAFINRQQISVTPEDIEVAKLMFPQWRDLIHEQAEIRLLSPHNTRAGERMPWYFGLYGVSCAPLVLLLSKLGMDASLGFPLTNALWYCIAIWVVYKKLQVKPLSKLILLILLCINPIIFYISWISSEVMLFSLITVAMVFWFNKCFAASAFWWAIASFSNPTLLIPGMVMSLEFLSSLFKESHCKIGNIGLFIKNKWKDIFRYFFAFTPALIPFAYNYYQIGYPNLIAHRASDFPGVPGRFWAYLFDLNFGFLPYFFFIMLLSCLLLFLELVYKRTRCLWFFGAFFAFVSAYSVMFHINSGMFAIARYNAFCAPILLFSITEYFNQCVMNARLFWKRIFAAFLALHVLCISLILIRYCSLTVLVNYTSMTPIASAVLNRYPALYNPLFSTFASRVNHVDGEYNYELPIIYVDEKRHVRKILANKNNIDSLQEDFWGNAQSVTYLKSESARLSENETYINIPRKFSLYHFPTVTAGDEVSFGLGGNDSPFIVTGFSSPEGGFRWTEGKEAALAFSINMDSQDMVAAFDIHPLVHGNLIVQHAEVFINRTKVEDWNIDKAEERKLLLPKSLSEYGRFIVAFKLPDAISPKELGINEDMRQLALLFRSIRFFSLSTDFVFTNKNDSLVFDFPPIDEGSILFGIDGNDSPFIVTGFSGPEGGFRWTEGKEAALAFRLNMDSQDMVAAFDIHPLVHGNLRVQRAEVFINGTKVEDWNIDKAEEKKLLLPKALSEDGSFIVTFKLPDAISPMELGVNEDIRQLALLFRSIKFYPE